MLDLAGPAQAFYEASQLGGSRYDLIYSATKREIRLEQATSLSNLVDYHGLTLRHGDFVCIPGVDFKSFSAGKMDAEIESIRSWLFQQKSKGVFLGSICSGALILAKAGILDRVQCTTHWKCLEYLQNKFPKTKVRSNRLYCFDQGVFTSAGMTAGIDMVLALIEQWDNPLVAAKVAQEMVINVRRADSVEQRNLFLDFKNHFNPEVYKAQEILSAKLSSGFTIDDLGKEMNMSPRQLSRLFKHHTGSTIQDYRDRVRITLGEQLLKYSEKSIKEIAIECGFENSRQFIRIWKKYHGVTPSHFRVSPIQQE